MIERPMFLDSERHKWALLQQGDEGEVGGDIQAYVKRLQSDLVHRYRAEQTERSGCRRGEAESGEVGQVADGEDEGMKAKDEMILLAFDAVVLSGGIECDAKIFDQATAGTWVDGAGLDSISLRLIDLPDKPRESARRGEVDGVEE